MSPSRIDLTGQRFGRLFVLYDAGSWNYKTKWVCRCDCGESCTVGTFELRRGDTRSCGCLNIQVRKAKATKHGDHGSPEYVAWKNMILRVTQTQRHNYHRYGGRGITVCRKWRTSYAAFLADVGRRPSRFYSLDRFPNPDGNYEPGNVRWATVKEQRANQGRPSC